MDAITKQKEAKKEEPAPEAAPEAPSMMGAMRQFIMLPVLWSSNKVDWADEHNLLMLRTAACVVVALCISLLLVAYSRASGSKSDERVQKPGAGQFLPKEGDAKMAADGSVSVKVYDVAMIKEAMMQFGMSVVIISVMHIKWAYTQPLLMVCIMQPLQIWDNKGMHVHLRGASGPGYERPWKKAAGGNPLQDWAEKKKTEMAEAEAEEKKKKLK